MTKWELWWQVQLAELELWLYIVLPIGVIFICYILIRNLIRNIK